ncbi:hypothetical protein, partial [Streptomyces clavuligerus]
MLRAIQFQNEILHLWYLARLYAPFTYLDGVSGDMSVEFQEDRGPVTHIRNDGIARVRKYPERLKGLTEFRQLSHAGHCLFLWVGGGAALMVRWMRRFPMAVPAPKAKPAQNNTAAAVAARRAVDQDGRGSFGGGAGCPVR